MARQDPLALDFLTSAVQHASPYAPLWFAHGIALAQTGEKNAALESYEKALALEPNHIAALTNSCVLLQELQQPEAAAARYHYLMALQK
jgi:protein O-GlcNAc transferase